MRVLVCGSRYWTNRDMILDRMLKIPAGATIVHGAAPGADSIAGDVAMSLGFEVDAYPAEWEKYGKAAGPIRNRQMLDTKPDLVIAFTPDLSWSRGTKDCVEEARRRGIPTEVLGS